MSERLFACPYCHASLDEDAACFRCGACDRVWPVQAGIPSFAGRAFYWNHMPQEKMPALLGMARERGYRQALEEYLLPATDAATVRYALDESRADFRVVLPLTRESHVLDLGCGWGAVAMGLARACALLVGADSTSETVSFVNIRAAQEGLANVQTVHVDPLDFGRLPFADRSFDVVVLNGVLEWVGRARLDKPVRYLQVAALREVRRLLKPGGCLYVGIENRYGALYWAGRRDHGGLPYTSILPRTIANLLCWALRGEPYRTYTYSRHGYRALLAEAGFAEPRFYLPLPTYRRPYYLLPLDGYPPLRYLLCEVLVRNNSPSLMRGLALRAARLLAWTGAYKALCPTFAIVAGRPQ